MISPLENEYTKRIEKVMMAALKASPPKKK